MTARAARCLCLLTLVLIAAAGCPPGAAAGYQVPEVTVPPGRSWLGEWIWIPGEPSPRNAYVHFRKSFELDSVPREAKLHLTADSRYIAYVNGERVGRGPVRSDRRWLYYDSWDVAGKLRKGRNTVAVLVHHYGEFTFQYMHGRGGLLADLSGFAGRTLARTDATWKAMRSPAWTTGQPRMSIQLGFNEVYDARQELSGWQKPEFDDRAWPDAVSLGKAGMEPWPHLVPRDIPAMAESPATAERVIETVEIRPAPPAQHVDLLPLMQPKEWGAAYLATTLTSPDRRAVELKLGSDDALKLWLNGRPVLQRLVSRAAAPDQDTARVTLEPGENRLLAKVVQGHSRWEFFFRVAGSGEHVIVAPWRVVGPFPFAMDPTLKSGFDAVFPPEAELGRKPGGAPEFSAAYRVSGGRELRWSVAPVGTAAAPHVARQMADRLRGPLARAEVRGSEELLRRGPGARIRTAPRADVSFLIDFGREVTGYPRFRVRGARGGESVEMGYGEVLQDERGGFVSPASGAPGRLNPDRDDVHYADRYTCRPGEQEFQTFDKRAFRYLQLDVRDAPAGITLDDVSLVFSTYPVRERGAFRCSDERLNRIWEVGRYTCLLNMEDGYTDCPWRERAQWWGDARVEALINYYCYGDHALIRKCLRQKAQSLNAEGITWGVYPTDWDGGRLPSFTLIWVSTLWDYYRYTGDTALLRELYPQVRYTLDRFFAPKVSPRGLLKDVPYWVFIDWAPVDTAGEGGALNAYYYDALRTAARIGALVGQREAAAEYDRRAVAVREAMNRLLWDAEAGAYRDSLLPAGGLSPKISQQTNSLCVLFDIAAPREHARILDFIYAPEHRSRVVEAGSPYFSYYQLAALFHAGRHEQALTYIREKWGRMLDWGATTWWEMWNPGASFCHGWSGGPTYNMGAEVLGIEPLKPGFAEVSVRPHFLGLQFASGIVPTEKGEIRVAWQRDQRGGSAALRLETPEGVPAEVTLPLAGTVTVNKKTRLPDGVTRLEAPAGRQRFRIEKGGTTLFEVREGR